MIEQIHPRCVPRSALVGVLVSLLSMRLPNNPDSGWLRNPFGDEKITLRSYLTISNLKPNHRKTLVVNSAEGWKTLVTSGESTLWQFAIF